VDRQDRHTAGPKDPYETVNRKVFSFNDTVDTYALKPVATAYTKVVPSPIRTGVHNFFGNFSDAWSAVNQLLQGKPKDAGSMTLRVLTNTTIGIAGLFDPATSLGLERKSEDLGQTLGVWGLEPGPYLVLPLFGSSDIRDGLALPADTYVSPALLVPKFWQGVAVDAVGVVDARAGLLGASQMLDELAFDRYTFMRDAYITRRRSLVYDGNPPELPDADDADDSKSVPAPAGNGAQSGTKPALPAAPAASGAKSSSAKPDAGVHVASATAATPSTPPSQPVPTAPSQPVPGGVQPAPMPASAPALPVPQVGPVPTPPPPASAAHG
jgi:phospholipid-binding lipoprotein MlaA